MVNIVPDNRLYNRTFLIVSHEYSNNGFLWYQDIISDLYASIGIWSLCFAFIVFESDNTFVQYFVMVLSLFAYVCVWPSACVGPQLYVLFMWFLCVHSYLIILKPSMLPNFIIHTQLWYVGTRRTVLSWLFICITKALSLSWYSIPISHIYITLRISVGSK